MTLAELLKTKRTLSFEVFPPKSGKGPAAAEVIDGLAGFAPDFLSCTSGAGGSETGRTLDVARLILAAGLPVIPHLTCTEGNRDRILAGATAFLEAGASGLLVLRGDFPPGYQVPEDGFAHACDLIAFLKAKLPALCPGAACYPETHLRAVSPQADIDFLRQKQDCGAEFAMTQLCYDVPAFERFLEAIRKAGVSIPVLVGVMPVTSRERTLRMTIDNGCSIPAELSAILGKYGADGENLAAAGIEYTAGLLRRFTEAGADGLHLYSMNNVGTVARVLETGPISR
ncbi:MAG: methylenetetrahydrofolate reductase [Treponema sp.]|nr:methylenetetrahydrofolate reductase [Treponema sp.]